MSQLLWWKVISPTNLIILENTSSQIIQTLQYGDKDFIRPILLF